MYSFLNPYTPSWGGIDSGFYLNPDWMTGDIIKGFGDTTPFQDTVSNMNLSFLNGNELSGGASGMPGIGQFAGLLSMLQGGANKSNDARNQMVRQAPAPPPSTYQPLLWQALNGGTNGTRRFF